MKKVLTFFSDSHKEIYENYFLETFNKVMSDEFTLISKKIDQVSPTGEYNSKGFDLAMMKKVDLIIDNIDPNDEDVIIYADCDIVFFKKLDLDFKDYDIFFQNNCSPGSYCAGFFIAKQSESLLQFYKFLKQEYIKIMNGSIDDQGALQYVMNKGQNFIKAGMLTPEQCYSIGFNTSPKVWNGQSSNFPTNLYTFHANWTIGVNNKLALLKLALESQKNN